MNYRIYSPKFMTLSNQILLFASALEVIRYRVIFACALEVEFFWHSSILILFAVITFLIFSGMWKLVPKAYRDQVKIWAVAWQNQQNDLSAQQRLESAWASAQSQQSSLCTLWVAKDPNLLQVDTEDWSVFAGHTSYFVGFVTLRLIHVHSV